MTVFSHFSIGITAMRAFRLGMNLSGYNVANSQTPGFSRRRVELATMPSVDIPGGWAGTGVDVSFVHRVRDPFIDFATRREMSRLGRDQAQSDVLSALEPTLGEVDSAALRSSISTLFDAFEQLTVQPDSLSTREGVVAAARELAATMRRTDSYLVDSRRNADDRVGEAVTRINEILGRLEQINGAVSGQEASGDEASDLRDERDRLVDELSMLAPVRVIESPNGQIGVYLESTGDSLLTGKSARPLEVQVNAEGLKEIYVSRGGEKVNLTSSLRGGQIGGYLAVRDDDIPAYRDRLDLLVSSVITEVNAVHRAGFDLNGAAGLNLFEPDPPGVHAASAIQVNAQIEQDPRLIAASSTAGPPVEPSNNENALALVRLRDLGLGALSGRTLAGYAADILGQIGRDAAESDAALQASQVIVDALDGRRQQMSGVSLDEEAADLVKWQQAFAAAATFMQTVNSVTEMAMSIMSR